MKNLYKNLNSKLKIRPIPYLTPKSAFIFIIMLFLLAGITGLVSVVTSFTTSAKNISTLEKENKILRERIEELTQLYKDLDKNLGDLTLENDFLRVAANLPPLSKDEKLLGTGGKEFDFTINSDLNTLKDVDQLTKYVETLSLKLKFEKLEYKRIADKLHENKLLYASIPALKPCDGILGERGFGMREHPILGINKMHEGIDIITDIGTKVICPGNGIVSFVGVKHGYGLCIEIEHFAAGYKTIYAHLSGTYVTENQKVTRGKVIAITGNSGLSTGPHLHYEVVHDGVKLDPSQFFFDDLVLFEQPKKFKLTK